jgi:hypothetical protein
MTSTVESRFYFVYLRYRVQHLHNFSGMNVCNERAGRNSFFVVSITAHYEKNRTIASGAAEMFSLHCALRLISVHECY